MAIAANPVEVRLKQRKDWTLISDAIWPLEMIRDSVSDESYYRSEEFQMLLALAYEQLWTTHDREKLRMLAAALSNSGSAHFQANNKD